MVREPPIDKLLDRERASLEAQERFGAKLDLLEEVVDYGTRLIARCYDSSDKGIHDVVIIVQFLKHAVTMLDGVHLLSRNGQTVATIPLLRGIIETSLCLEWLLAEDTKRRATMYFVWDKRRALYWAKCLRQGTKEHAEHMEHMKHAPVRDTVAGLSQDQIQEQIDLLEKALTGPDLRTVNEQFERASKGGRDRAWYTPSGVQNLRELAKKLNKEWVYKVFYGIYSQVAHSDAFEEHVSFERDQIVFEPIRNSEKMGELLSNTLTYGIFEIYYRVLAHYRPGEEKNFQRKYIEEWRPRFRSG